MLWVSGTNPAVSLPEPARIRALLSQERLFLVVQDLCLTETAWLAHVVLATATWGEKTGTFANETTLTTWDPASKQPLLKTAATALAPLTPADGRPPGRRSSG